MLLRSAAGSTVSPERIAELARKNIYVLLPSVKASMRILMRRQQNSLDWAVRARRPPRDVHLSMATHASCDRVFFCILAEVTTKLFVVDFQGDIAPHNIVPHD